MRKTVAKPIVTIMTILFIILITGCAKKPSEVIVGEWEGEGEVEVSENEPQVSDFTVIFTQDGEVEIVPEKDEPAEGTYEVDDDGNITAMVTVPGEDRELEFSGSLDMESEKIELSATLVPTDEDYSRIKEMHSALKEEAEKSGEEFTEPLPTKEDLTATISMTLERAVKEEKKQ